MKKNQIYIILLFIFISATQVFSQELVFGTQNFPPFSYTSNEGVAKGPGVQLIKAVCKEAQLKYAFKIGLWQGIQNRVKNKRSKINSLFFLGKNAKREKWLYFTPPIIQTEYGFFAKKDSRIRYTKNKKTKNRLSSYTIGVYGPSNTERVLKKLQKAGGGFAIKIFRDSGSTLKNLSFRNSLSMVFSNREVGMSIIDKNNYANLEYVGFYKKVLYYIAFSKDKVSEKTKNKFIESYNTLKKNGTINNILSRYKIQMVK